MRREGGRDRAIDQRLHRTAFGSQVCMYVIGDGAVDQSLHRVAIVCKVICAERAAVGEGRGAARAS
eukprot:1891536-Rhodomonas_salina.1